MVLLKYPWLVMAVGVGGSCVYWVLDAVDDAHLAGVPLRRMLFSDLYHTPLPTRYVVVFLMLLLSYVAYAVVRRARKSESALLNTNRQLSGAISRLKQAERQLIQQERLRAVGAMASGIAHDFNNQLQPILGYTELLLNAPQYLEDREKTLKCLEAIYTAAKDAAAVVSRIQEFCVLQRRSEQVEPTDINEVVEDAVSFVEPRLHMEQADVDKHVEIVTNLHPLPSLYVSPSEMREVLTNLLFNALDAISRKGRITVTTYLQGSFVCVEVADTGRGMEAEERQHCFSPLFTTKPGGAGLGLSISKSILQRYQGDLVVKETSPGGGTTFLMKIPIHTPQEEMKEDGGGETRPKDSSAGGDMAVVLLVEDEDAVRKVVAEQLLDAGYRVICVSSVNEAVDVLKVRWVDVVITDQAMKDLSGTDLVRYVKERYPSLGVIVLTGFGDGDLFPRARWAGADLVLGKPVEVGELKRAIERVRRPVR